MGESNNKGIYIIVGTLCVCVIALAIAYAALTSTLKINFGNVTQSQQSWNVSFVGDGTTVAGNASGTSNNGLSCGQASIRSDQVSVENSSVSKPGDKCVYSLTIQNTGTINANLQTITAIKPTEVNCTINGASMVCGNVTYKLTTDAAGDTLLTANTGLNASGTLGVYLTVEYTGTSVTNTVDVQTGAGFSLFYNQA